MPITPLRLDLDTPEAQIFGLCDSVGLGGKEANEVLHSFDAIRVWRGRFETLYGPLVGCSHHSNPNDPPDLTLSFRDRVIPVEHTRLEPFPYGWMNDIHHKELSNHCISVPSVTAKPKSRAALISSMTSFEGEWSDAQADLNEWYLVCMRLIRRKIEHQRGGILVIQDTSLFSGNDVKAVAEGIHCTLSPRRKLIQDWTIILHSRANSLQFNSYLIAPLEPLQSLSQNGKEQESSV